MQLTYGTPELTVDADGWDHHAVKVRAEAWLSGDTLIFTWRSGTGLDPIPTDDQVLADLHQTWLDATDQGTSEVASVVDLVEMFVDEYDMTGRSAVRAAKEAASIAAFVDGLSPMERSNMEAAHAEEMG